MYTIWCLYRRWWFLRNFKPTSIIFGEDQKENILFKNENGVLFLFIAIGARFSVYSSEGKQFHFASFVMIYLIAKISKTNSSISIYYFTRACSAILLLRKYPSIALRQSRHDCSCCVNVNGKILKIICLIISILSGSSGSFFPTPLNGVQDEPQNFFPMSNATVVEGGYYHEFLYNPT